MDRALVKRIMREEVRHALPDFESRCRALGVGLDVSLRFRTPLRTSGAATTQAQARALVRGSCKLCLKALSKRLPQLAGALESAAK